MVRSGDDGHRSRNTILIALALILAANPPAAAIPPGVALRTPIASIPGQRGPRFSVGRLPVIDPAGGYGVERSAMGAMPVATNLDLGIGLYSVQGARVKERDFKRMRPMEDVTTRGRTVAAVGLNLRF